MFSIVISFQFGDRLNLTLITNNLAHEPRTLTMALTLVRLNSNEQLGSMLEELNQVSHQDPYVPQNTDPNTYSRDSQIPIQSLVQTFHLYPNHRE